MATTRQDGLRRRKLNTKDLLEGIGGVHKFRTRTKSQIAWNWMMRDDTRRVSTHGFLKKVKLVVLLFSKISKQTIVL